jgi:hypothetical protein
MVRLLLRVALGLADCGGRARCRRGGDIQTLSSLSKLVCYLRTLDLHWFRFGDSPPPTVESVRKQTSLLAAVLVGIGLNVMLQAPMISARSSDTKHVGGTRLAMDSFSVGVGIAGLALLALGTGLYFSSEELRAGAGAIVETAVWRRERSIIARQFAFAFTILLVLVIVTGGPFHSPLGQYLLAGLVLAQLLAPTKHSVVKVLIGSIPLVAVADLTSQLMTIHPQPYSVWEFAVPALVVGVASTYINWSNLPGIVADQRNSSR